MSKRAEVTEVPTFSLEDISLHGNVDDELKVECKTVHRSKKISLRKLGTRLKINRGDRVDLTKRNVITNTFNRRECCKFVPRSVSTSDQRWCKCGRLTYDHIVREHDWNPSPSLTDEWDPIKDTKKYPTNAYGEINFLNDENDILPLYLRCEMDVKVDKLGDLLLRKWAIPRPNILISVFGGHAKFDSKKLSVECETEIKEGLVKVARDTKAWLFTDGLDHHHGVSNLVGNAVAMKRSFVDSTPVIGVNAWGAVHGNQDLIEGEEQGRFPAFYKAVPQSELEWNEETRKYNSLCLEHEHTHFILLDFGTKNNFHEHEVKKFRIKLQEHLRTKTEAQLVSVLIEGGCDSLEEAHLLIKKGIPIVVLGDTGKVSSVISEAVDLAKIKGRQGALVNDDRLRVRQALTVALPDLKENKYDEMMEVIEDIISHKELVTIWRCGKGDDLDTAILEGLIKSIAKLFPETETIDRRTPFSRTKSKLNQLRESQKERAKALMKRQLELAIQWGRLDIATEYIFDNVTSKSKVEPIFTESELNDMLGLAILHKQTRFIRNIIDREANIKTFLTVERFETMLRKNTPENSMLYELLQDKCDDPDDWKFEHFEMIIHDMSEGVFKVPGKTKPSTVSSNSLDNPENNIIVQAIRKCITRCGEGCHCSYKFLDKVHNDTAGTMELEEGMKKETSTTDSPGNRTREYEFEDPASLLTVYMVMIHEQDMAKVLWEYSQSGLFLSLVCTCIHNWMFDQKSKSIFISDSLGEQLQIYAQEFVEISNHVLEEVACYKTEYVIALVNFKFDKWGGRTILEMADYINNFEIIAHPTVQDYIDLEWKGWLDSDMSTIRTIVSIFCPLLASFRNVTPFDKLKSKRITSSRQKSRNRLQSFVERGNGPVESEKDEKLDIVTQCRYFYKAPVVKFWAYQIMYGAFLFSYVCALLLNDKHEKCDRKNTFRMMFNCKLTLSQQFTYICAFCLLSLEIRQVYFSYPTTWRGKLKMYFSNTYNKCDALSMVTILVSLVFKMRADQEAKNFDMTMEENVFRLLFAFAFILFCGKLCQALTKSEQIGPKVMMMAKMLVDLKFFIFLVLILVIAYGVSTASILNPQKFDSISSSFETVFDIFWRPYQNMFGEIDDDSVTEVMNKAYCILATREPNPDAITAGSSYTWNTTYCDSDYSCSENSNVVCMMNIYIIRILLAGYMMLAAVLMLNLMVAVFTNTYDGIQEKYKSHWKRQKFDLMIEYRSRSPLPLPFSTVLHICRFFLLMFRTFTCGKFSRCCGSDEAEDTIDVHQRLTITLLEIECRRNYLDKNKGRTNHEILQSEISKLSSEVGNIDKRLEDFETRVQKVIDIAQPQCKDQVFSPQESISVGDMPPSDEIIITSDGLTVIAEEAPDEFATSHHEKRSPVNSSLNVSRLIKMGRKSRQLKYPCEKNIRRSNVKKEHWDWRKLLLNYEPLEYTDPSLPYERKLSEIRWHNNVDGDERRSYEGCFEIRNQLPLNPCGRTGLSGRGLLEKFGPNHAALPIITRYAYDDDGSGVMMDGRKVLEVLLNCRRGDELFLPEIKGIYNDLLPREVRGLLTSLVGESKTINHDKLVKRIDNILKAGILIYKGFLDSEYNTDNSWLEGILVSYHDIKDHTFRHLIAPEDSKYRWTRISNWANVNDTHREYLQRAFYSRNGNKYD